MYQKITITLNDEQLYNSFIYCDYRAIEKVGALVYEQVYEDIYNIEMNDDKNKQYGEGDFIVIYDKKTKKKHTNSEVKKATVHDELIKGVFDVRYLTIDLTEPKEQGIYGDKGWLLTLLSDTLMFHVVSDGKIYYYIIKNIQDTKENLVRNLYMDDRKYNLLNSYGKELRDNIAKANEELEVKGKKYNYYIQDDKNKKTLCLSLHLDKYFSGFARCEVDIIEIQLE